MSQSAPELYIKTLFQKIFFFDWKRSMMSSTKSKLDATFRYIWYHVIDLCWHYFFNVHMKGHKRRIKSLKDNFTSRTKGCPCLHWICKHRSCASSNTRSSRDLPCSGALSKPRSQTLINVREPDFQEKLKRQTAHTLTLHASRSVSEPSISQYRLEI